MENKPTIKTPVPTTSVFRNSGFCILIFAFSTYLSCHEFIATEPPFLSMDYFSVFSVFSVAISFVPPWLCGHESIMQNKPNCRNDKTNATSCAPKIYINMSLRSAPKNKPNQTQFPRPKVAPEKGRTKLEGAPLYPV